MITMTTNRVVTRMKIPMVASQMHLEPGHDAENDAENEENIVVTIHALKENEITEPRTINFNGEMIPKMSFDLNQEFKVLDVISINKFYVESTKQ